jgi:AsmA protein
MKGVKIVGVVVGGLIGLVLLVGLAVSLFFDPNDYRDELAAQVQEQTGRELEIDGDLKLSIFPWLAVEVGPARLSDAQGFGDKPFAEIQGARAGIRLLPLLSRRVEISELRLDGMRLRLITDKQGKTNWADLAGDDSEDASDASSDGAGPDLDALSIGSIVISDASLLWDDRQSGSSMELTDFNLSTGSVSLAEPTDLTMSFGLVLDDKQSMQLELATTLEIASGFSAIAASDLDLDIQLSGPELPGGSIEMKGGVESLNLNLDDGELSVKGLLAQALGASLEAQLTGTAVTSDTPRIKGMIKVPAMNLREVLAKAGSPVVTGDPQAMSSFGLDATLAYDGKSVVLSDLKAVLDQTRLDGRFSIVDLDSQAMTFDLAVDAIDLDRYLPPAEEDAEEAGSGAAVDEELDLSGLKSLNAKGQLKVGELRLSGLVFTDALVGVNAAGGVLRLNPLKTKFYGGQYEGDVRLDATGDQARLSLNERLTAVQLAPVMKVLSDHEFVSGAAGGGFTLSATGKTVKGMLASLSGNLDLAVSEGALEGVDLVYELQRAQSLLAKQAPAARSGEARTPFDAMKVSATVKDGVINSDDLNISNPVMKITGAGGVNLVAQTLDYRLKAKVHEAPPADATQDLGDLRGATIPLRIGGTLSEPRITVDVEDVIKEKAKEQIEEKVDEWKKKLFGN